MPDFRTLGVEVKKPGTTQVGNAGFLGILMREIMRRNKDNFRLFGSDESQSNRLDATHEVTQKAWLAEYFPEDADGGHLAPDGRVMEMLSEHTLEGWLEGYILSGRHGLINSHESFVHLIDSMVNQHAEWLEKCNELPWRMKVYSLNILVSGLVWRQDHNGFTHQDPGFLDNRGRQRVTTRRLTMRASEQMQKMKTQPGFVAALDQSGGSTPHALALHGIKDHAWKDDDEMF